MNDLVRFALVAFFPRVDDLPGLAELGVDDKIAALRRESTWLFWIGVVGAAFFFQIAPVLTVRRPLPAAWLDDVELDAHAHALGTHRVYAIRQIAVLLKLVAGMFWAESKEIRAFLALPPYGPSPGTRRTEREVKSAELAPRAPVEVLVTLGRREREIGRLDDAAHTAKGKVV